MKRFLLISVAVALFASCTRNTDCPAFPATQRAWLPYHTDEQVFFLTQGSSQMFVFNDVFFTRSYTIGSTEACDCEAQAYCKSKIDTVNCIQLSCSAQKQNLRTEFEFKFQHYGYRSNYFVPVNLDNFLFSIKNDGTIENATPVDSMEVNNVWYRDVLMIEIDTVAYRSSEIYKLFIAKDKGVVRYDYKSGKSYVLRDL